MYQLVEGKQKFASQIMTSKSPVRSADDIDETALSYAEIKMLATGNPYIKEKMDLDIQVQKLRLLKSSYLSEIYALEDKIIKYFPQQIAVKTELISALESDLATAQEHPKPTDDRFVGIEVKGAFCSEKTEGGQKIIDACQQMNSPDPITLGTYRGFGLELSFDTMGRTYKVKIRGAASRTISLGTDPAGNITRIDNAIEKISDNLEAVKAELEGLEKQFEVAKEEVKKPFSKEQELKEKTDRLNVLNALLNVDKEYSDYGCPYVQEDCDMQEPSDNLVIYGHHMSNDSMFAHLEKFKSKDFWSEHRIITFNTLTDKQEYEIVAVFRTVVYTDSPEAFKFYRFIDAESANAFDDFIAKSKKLSFYDTGVTAEYGDKLITLSTCEYSRNNSRLVVVAKRITEDGGADAAKTHAEATAEGERPN